MMTRTISLLTGIALWCLALSESEVHQIAGRAGRFGMHEEGFAGVLKEAEQIGRAHV